MTKHTLRFRPNGKKQVDDVMVFQRIADGVRGIQVGDSKDVVVREWGPPNSIEQDGNEDTFLYNGASESFDVLFADEKVKDIRSHQH